MNKPSFENIEENSENDSSEIVESLERLFKHYNESKEEKFRNRYKGNKYAMMQFTQAKQFWANFPKVRFRNQNHVNKLRQLYKDNKYILKMIDKYTHPLLDSAFCRPLYKANVELYSNIAKVIVDQAILQKKMAIIRERPIISVKLDDNLVIPFYISTGKGGKLGVEKNKFYPIFGISTDDGYLNKLSQSDINNYYGVPLLAAIAIELNNRYKEKKIDPHSRPKLSKSEIIDGKLVYHEDYKKFVAYANLGKNPDDHDQIERVARNINATLRKIEGDRVDVANNIMRGRKYFFESIKNFIEGGKKNDVISLVNRLFDDLYFSHSADEFKRGAIYIYGELIALGYESIKNGAKKGMISPKVEEAAQIYNSSKN